MENFLCTFLENLFTLLKTDGVDDAFSLNALQSFFDNRPFRAVDHYRYAGDFRFGCDKVEKLLHHLFRVEHTLIQIDINNLCAAFNLLVGNGECLIVVAVLYKACKFFGSGYICSFANIDKPCCAVDPERFKP